MKELQQLPWTRIMVTHLALMALLAIAGVREFNQFVTWEIFFFVVLIVAFPTASPNPPTWTIPFYLSPSESRDSSDLTQPPMPL